MMSITGDKRSLLDAARYVWGLGGLRAYYRGLTVRLQNSCTLYTLELGSDLLTTQSDRIIGCLPILGH